MPADRSPVSAMASKHSKPTIGVVTVTYNSGAFFPTYMQALQGQTRAPDRIVIVDSGSTEPAFLAQAQSYGLPAEVVYESNIGFAVGNNLGWRRIRDCDYILFLNPDAFLTPDFIEQAIAYMESEPQVGMVTPSLLRYSIETHKALTVVDTTGVVRNWYGKISERDQMQPAESLKRHRFPNEIPWVCAAVALGRREAITAVLEHGDQIFDESFFMYKEDTDLSWRIRRAGWKLMHHPDLVAYHCRGWQNRKRISRQMRLLSTRNEVKMCLKNRSPFVVVGALKYLLVRYFDL